MAVIDLEFPSYNQRDAIKAWLYTPLDAPPRGVVQVVHGLMEHSRRYLHLILKLNDAGFAVFADDHAGHGLTGTINSTLGDYGDKGHMTAIEDEHSLRQIAAEKYPDIPYIMFGHSWGSMIARAYAAHHGEGMSALIICGTCAELPALDPMADELEKLIAEGKGSESDIWTVTKTFGSMNDRIESPATPTDWISKDAGIVLDYLSDPYNNLRIPPTFQSTYDLCTLVKEITGEQWAEKVPKNLPIYNIAGDEDPVGYYGEGVYRVSNWLISTGHKDVSTKLYPGHRHEIHQDRDIRDEVASSVIDFINRALG
ncbi:MAG: alpha/beta hydrolase [Clostridiales bacterium]|jgi:alpha-beta hydrolase superfamily lysophospholipase|nr:alpha/beta hydrolase [Clostridiales bacterium]